MTFELQIIGILLFKKKNPKNDIRSKYIPNAPVLKFSPLKFKRNSHLYFIQPHPHPQWTLTVARA